MGLNANSLNPAGHLATLPVTGMHHGPWYFTRLGEILFGLDTIQEVISPAKQS